MLVNAIFAMQCFEWHPSRELDHLELFAGDCSVTRGEFQDSDGKNCLTYPATPVVKAEGFLSIKL